MNEERFALFGAVYSVELERAVLEHPEEYTYGVAEVPAVVGRMLEAIRRGSYNKDSRALRATFRAFGIRHTYTALRGWLADAGAPEVRPVVAPVVALRCDAREDCRADVSMIDNKGFDYCTADGLARRFYLPCRKLRPWEVRRLERGRPLTRY